MQRCIHMHGYTHTRSLTHTHTHALANTHTESTLNAFNAINMEQLVLLYLIFFFPVFLPLSLLIYHEKMSQKATTKRNTRLCSLRHTPEDSEARLYVFMN